MLAYLPEGFRGHWGRATDRGDMMRLLILLVSITAVAISGCHAPLHDNLPPANMLMEPGPGVGGPGPGVMTSMPSAPMVNRSSQVAFIGPEGMTVAWDVSMPGQFDSEPLICPGRYNFPQGAIYRLKLTNIPGRPGVELYPTLEVGPSMPRTEAFLSHNSIPVQFTPEDFDQVLTGNFVTKVIYLPDAEHQELAIAGVETLVSTRLDPGVDPIVEADRRGAILGVIRLGNKDLEIPGQEPDASGVMPVGYMQAIGTAAGVPHPMGGPMAATTMPTGYISGVTGPQYGMPMSGTPVGLPGPPHVPLGIPAGLQRHAIKNHTRVNMPGPTSHVKIDVKQSPGFSYPKPANHAFITERTIGPLGTNRRPISDLHQVIDTRSGTQGCAYPSEGGGCQ